MTALVVDGRDEVLKLSGRDLGASSWKTVTQGDIDAFAQVSGDHQWIHVDADRAADGPYGRTIAHGFMTLSWGVPMFAELLVITGVGRSLNYGVNKVRFPSPVPVGSRVRLNARVLSVEPVPSGGLEMVRGWTFELEGAAKPACVAESVKRFYL